MRKLSTLLGALALASTVPATATAQTFVTIGTGGQTGVYYVVGQSICKLVNRGTSKHSIKCTAPSTGGSIANLNAINIGDLDVIRGKLEAAREGCLEINQPDLADKLREAVEALDQADLKTYRRRVEAVVSKLGHMR